MVLCKKSQICCLLNSLTIKSSARMLFGGNYVERLRPFSEITFDYTVSVTENCIQNAYITNMGSYDIIMPGK